MRKYQQNIPSGLRLKFRLMKLRFAANRGVKRGCDLLIAALAMMILSPILILVSVLIKLDSNGPVFFKQDRVGLDGALFSMWKFRSMTSDAEVARTHLEAQNEMQNGVLFKMKKDPRITRVGRFIRKASIDELPQLLNVLKGDMSLVGPRPPLPSEVDEYGRFDHARLSVLPGITCLWQVQGRSDIPFEQQVKLDVEYIETQSIKLDLILLLKTIPAVLTARGAY